MEEKKVARFWDIEKELRITLLSINDQLKLTCQALSAQLSKLQELFLQYKQLGNELGFDVDSLDVKELYENISNNELFQADDSLRNDMRAEKSMTHGKRNNLKG